MFEKVERIAFKVFQVISAIVFLGFLLFIPLAISEIIDPFAPVF